MDESKQEEEDKVSIAATSTFSKASFKSNTTFSASFTSAKTFTKPSGIGAFQRVVPKFTGSSLGFSRGGDPSVLAWAARCEPSRLGESSLNGIEGNKEEMLKLIEEKLNNQRTKLDRAHAVDIKNIKKVVIHESIEFLKRNCSSVETLLTKEH